ncbi:MAG: DinB family protein [Chloroflexota bacterium]
MTDNMPTYRKWAIQQLQRNITIYSQVVLMIPADVATTARDGGDGWTITEVMGHLRDFEDIFMERARLTATEDMPPLRFPDPDALAQENNYNADKLADVYTAWAEKRRAFLAYLETLTDEQWSRPGAHPKRGPFTLNDQLLLAVWHDNLHLEQIVKILSEKHA